MVRAILRRRQELLVIGDLLEDFLVLQLDSVVMLAHLVVLVDQLHVVVVKTVQLRVELHQPLLQKVGVVRVELLVVLHVWVGDDVRLDCTPGRCGRGELGAAQPVRAR